MYVGYTAPTRRYELDHTDHTDHTDHADHTDHTDHTDQEYILPERSKSPSGNQPIRLLTFYCAFFSYGAERFGAV